MHKIANVTVLNNYKLELQYENGHQGIVDLSHLVGKGVFSLWNDYDVFRKVKIGSSGELVWNNQVDLCPDSLYLKLTKIKPAVDRPIQRISQLHLMLLICGDKQLLI